MNEPVPAHVTTSEVMPFDLTPTLLDMFERIATLMGSAGAAVPEHCRGKAGTCFAIICRAHGWRMDPFALAGKTFVVGNQLGYEAQAIGAAINTSGLLKDRLNFEWFGEWENVIGRFVTRESRTKKNEHGEAQTYRAPAWEPEDEEGLGVRVWATLKGEDEPRVLEVLLTQARVRNSTMWADDPKQQIGYLAEKKWGRLYTPEVLLGVKTADDIAEANERDMGMVDEVQPATSGAPTRAEEIRERLSRPKPAPLTLANVLKEIEAAFDKLTLNAAGERAGQLADAAEKSQARKAWKERREAIAAEREAMQAAADAKKAQQPAETPAQAPAQADPASDSPTYAHVAYALNTAMDHEALAVAADLMRAVESEQHRKELGAVYEHRKAELDNQLGAQ